MRIKRGIAVPTTLAATLAIAMSLATPAYAAITTLECENRGGEVDEDECVFVIEDAEAQSENEDQETSPENDAS